MLPQHAHSPRKIGAGDDLVVLRAARLELLQALADFTIDPAECEAVKNFSGWRFEGYDFSASPAGRAGNCPSGTVPVYRAYNNRFAMNDSNHRYTTDKPSYDDMVRIGWLGEGVVFCVPQ
jgi:hypothetical protein